MNAPFAIEAADRHDSSLNVIEWVRERIAAYGAMIDAAGDISPDGLARFDAAKARMKELTK